MAFAIIFQTLSPDFGGLLLNDPSRKQDHVNVNMITTVINRKLLPFTACLNVQILEKLPLVEQLPSQLMDLQF
jgi:hypothetical protein